MTRLPRLALLGLLVAIPVLWGLRLAGVMGTPPFYALLALGYTMVYGVLRFINFAHSDVFMVGAFIGYYAGKLVPENTLWGGMLVLIAAMAGCAILGMTIERLAYRPLRSAATLNVLITAMSEREANVSRLGRITAVPGFTMVAAMNP